MCGTGMGGSGHVLRQRFCRRRVHGTRRHNVRLRRGVYLTPRLPTDRKPTLIQDSPNLSSLYPIDKNSQDDNPPPSTKERRLSTSGHPFLKRMREKGVTRDTWVHIGTSHQTTTNKVELSEGFRSSRTS